MRNNILKGEMRFKREEPSGFCSLKGQQQAVTAILLSGILIGIVGSVYLWGLPLIQKNKDISLLQSSEKFMETLDAKIKTVANTGGRDQLKISVDGVMRIENSPDGWILQFDANTQGTIYAADAPVPLKNSQCTASQGIWGSDDAGVLCVLSRKLDESNYLTTYTLRYIPLKTETRRVYSIALTAEETESGGTDHTIVIENSGTSESEQGSDIVTTTSIRVDII